MLTQGSVQDPKCKLNISSFLTLPYPFEWVTYAKDIMIIVLLLHMMGEWEGWGGGEGFIYVRVWLRGQGVGGYDRFSNFSVFLLLLIVLAWVVHDSCCVCFIVSYLLSLCMIPLIRCY